MRQGPFFLLIAAIAAVVVIPIVLLDSQDASQPEPTSTPGVVATARVVNTVPHDPEATRNVTSSLGRTLRELYGRAFLNDEPVRSTAESPEPTPATRVDDLFTEKARAGLRKNPNVFRLVEDLDVGSSRVTFSGVVTLDGSRPVDAALEVEFVADAVPAGRSTPVVRIRQRGSMLLVARPEGWRIDAFDLDFDLRPKPSPSPEAT